MKIGKNSDISRNAVTILAYKYSKGYFCTNIKGKWKNSI